MNFKQFGQKGKPVLVLVPGLGVSYEIFLPLIKFLEYKFTIVAVQVDGFTIGEQTKFTSVLDQAEQLSNYIKDNFASHISVAYGLSLGGKILSHVMEKNDVTIDYAIMDAAPLLPLPKWLVSPLAHLQAFNVWSCYKHTSFWRRVFNSHYYDVLFDECKKIYPFSGKCAVIDGYKSVYTTRLNSISGKQIYYWYGTKEAFVAKPQVKHLKALFPQVNVKVFPKLNHGQLLVDYPEEVAQRIISLSQHHNGANPHRST